MTKTANQEQIINKILASNLSWYRDKVTGDACAEVGNSVLRIRYTKSATFSGKHDGKMHYSTTPDYYDLFWDKAKLSVVVQEKTSQYWEIGKIYKQAKELVFLDLIDEIK